MMGNKESRVAWLVAVVALSFSSLLGCGSKGARGATGAPGASPDAGGCTIADNGDGTSTVTCNGTSVTISNGKAGEAGLSGQGCTAVQVDGGVAVTCGDAGTTIYNGTNGANGNNGQNGLNAGKSPGLTVAASASDPANGKYFDQGEKIVYTATLTTAAGAPVDLSYFKTAALYMNGPRDVLKDKTAVKLLGCSTDRTQDPHYEIDLLANPAPANLVVSGNKITYTMNAITDEDQGTYTIGLRLVPKDYPFDATFQLTDVQIKTATVEPLIVGVDKADGTGSCADCHKGAANGREYMHHIDPGYSPTGSPEIDSVPVRTCLMCHNQDGYSAIQVCADNTKASGGKCDDNSTPTYMPDPIVRRVHGVHMGENLLSKLDSQDFGAYSGLVFPAGIKDCTKCHNNTDTGGDTWKTQASREACGACHDQIDWTTGDMVPHRPTTVACTQDSDCSSLNSMEAPVCNTTSGLCEYTKHGGGGQSDDTQCMTCHGAGKMAPIDVVHQISPPAAAYTVDISLSAPANTTDYEGNEAPVVTITLKDAATGNAVDPTAAMPKAAQFFVSGPREDTMPVLTTAADDAAAGNATGHYVYVDLTAGNAGDSKLTVDSSGFTYDLDPVTGLKPGTYTVFARFQKASEARSYAVVNFQVGTATEEPMVATDCTSCHEDTRMHGYAKFNPDICKNCHDYQAQDMSVATETNPSWTTGSRYGFGTTPISRRVHGVHFGKYLSHPEQNTNGIDGIIFPQDVRNCVKCHSTSDAWKTEPGRIPCLACHDSDADQAHGALMTVDPTPTNPYSGDEVESCKSCHGPGSEFSVENVHNITDPYAPPYPR